MMPTELGPTQDETVCVDPCKKFEDPIADAHPVIETEQALSK